MKITIVTSNAGKAREVAAFFGGLLEVDHVALDIPEYRSNDIAEIAREKVRYAYGQLNTPLIVDDTGFFIDALEGFPGPYAAYILNSIGNAGILKLMDGVSYRDARFTTGIAYADEYGIKVFTGTLEGKIALCPKGTNGFGYDPIFLVGDTGKTMAELSTGQKNRISHRARAIASARSALLERLHKD